MSTELVALRTVSSQGVVGPRRLEHADVRPRSRADRVLPLPDRAVRLQRRRGPVRVTAGVGRRDNPVVRDAHADPGVRARHRSPAPPGPPVAAVHEGPQGRGRAEGEVDLIRPVTLHGRRQAERQVDSRRPDGHVPDAGGREGPVVLAPTTGHGWSARASGRWRLSRERLIRPRGVQGRQAGSQESAHQQQRGQQGQQAHHPASSSPSIGRRDVLQGWPPTVDVARRAASSGEDDVHPVVRSTESAVRERSRGRVGVDPVAVGAT